MPTGQYHNGILCADLTDLPFDDYTLDVFEHLFDPALAIKEIFRVLKTGGVYFMTVPLERQHEATEKACNDNTLVHIPTTMSMIKGVELEYHGNPVDDKGAVVTYYYGYDLVDFIRKHCTFSCFSIMAIFCRLASRVFSKTFLYAEIIDSSSCRESSVDFQSLLHYWVPEQPVRSTRSMH